MEEGARNGFLDVKEAASKVKKYVNHIAMSLSVGNIYIPLDKEYRIIDYLKSLHIIDRYRY